jgi:acyl dehydratase
MTSTAGDAQFHFERLDQWTEDEAFAVRADAIQAYAEATNDASPLAAAGTVAPPVFSVVPTWDPMAAVTKATVAEPIRPLVVHGEHDIWLHRPLAAGAEVSVRVAAVGIHAKASGTTLIVRNESRDAEGTLLNTQYSTQFYRGVTGGPSDGETAPGHALPAEAAEREPDAEIAYRIDEDQTVRYAAASGDDFPIHLDDEKARAVGLPGRIVHGLCVLAFAGRAVLELDGRDVDAFRRLAVRFSRPVFPGALVTTRLWRVETAGDGTTYAFEAHTEDGTVVLKDGLAVVGSWS